MARSFVEATRNIADRALQFRQLRNQEEQQGLDNIVKRAQLGELGFTSRTQPGQPRSFMGLNFGTGPSTEVFERDPNYVSAKALEGQKVQAEINKMNREAEESQFIKDYMMGSMPSSQDSSPRTLAPHGQAQPTTQPGQRSFNQGALTAPPFKTFKVGGQEIVNPAWEQYEMEKKRQEELQKPLSGEASAKLSGGRQGVENVRDIIKIAKLKKDSSGNISAREDMKGLIAGQKAASFQEPRIPIIDVPITGGITEGIVQAFAGNDARKFDLYINTLAENMVRARTGATVTKKEEVNEQKRTYLRLLDNPEVMLERIKQDEKYLRGVAEGIRPGSTADIDTELPSESLVPEWVPKNLMEQYSFAKNTGYSDEEIKAFLTAQK